MKVQISPDTVAALNEFIADKAKTNPEIGTSCTVTVNQIVLEFLANATATQTESLLKRLVTPGKRREQLLKHIARLSLNADSDAIYALEKTLGKLQKYRDFKADSTENRIQKNAVSTAIRTEI